VYRYHDHPGAEAIYGVGEGDAGIAEELVAEALAYLDLGREDEVGVEELEAEAKLGSEVERGDLDELVGALGAGVGCQVIVKLATDEGVEAEVFDAVALKLELEGQVHVYALYGAGRGAVGGYAILKHQLFFAEGEAGHKAEVYKAAQLKVAHNAQVKAGLPQGLYALKGIGLGKRLAIVDLVHGKVEPEGDAEVVELVIMIGHIKQGALRECTRGYK